MTKRLLTIALSLWIVCELHAQDIRFTQYFQAPIYLNPAFTGATQAARIGTNYRLQGTTSESAYSTTSAFADYYYADFYLSGGLLFVDDRDQYSGFRSTTVAVPLSYDFAINRNLIIKPALQGSYTTQRIDFGNFLFGDQIDPDGNVTGGTGEPLALSDRIGFADLAMGVMTYGVNWWGGYALHNMLNNNISFVQGGESRLPLRHSFHGGITINLKKTTSRNRIRRTVMPTFNYVHQGGFNQLDAGAIFHIDPIVVGAMYRGIPNPLYVSDYSAVAWVIGVRKYDLNLTYSYDMPIQSATNPGGIHEVSLSFVFDPSDPNATPRSAKRLKCPLVQ